MLLVGTLGSDVSIAIISILTLLVLRLTKIGHTNNGEIPTTNNLPSQEKCNLSSPSQHFQQKITNNAKQTSIRRIKLLVYSTEVQIGFRFAGPINRPEYIAATVSNLDRAQTSGPIKTLGIMSRHNSARQRINLHFHCQPFLTPPVYCLSRFRM